MITKLSIQNFKSLENVAIDCSNLNVLTGLNGMGKSAIIQALLLLRQSHEKGTLQNDGLALNGDLIQIGTVKDAFYEFASSEDMIFTVNFDDNDDKPKSWNFVRSRVGKASEPADYKNADYMPYSNAEAVEIPEYFEEFSLFKNNTFKYLNADRLVKNEYETSDLNVVRNRYLGKNGEYATHYLLHYATEEVHPDLIFQGGSQTNQLAVQVSEWMSEISPGIKIKPERIKGVNSVKLRYVYENGASTDEIAPLNIGFGITYILSVLVALLSAKKGDILIIENPESHIHPRAQSIIGKLIAKVAETGAQLFVETHSDHIINGILVSAYLNNLKKEKGISVENLKIHFIKRIENSFASEKILIHVEANGRIKGIPEGFFDQYSKDMKTIIGF